MLKNTKPVHKITIVPRMTGSLGYTMQIEDEEEKFLKTREEMMNEIKILLGGRSAEEEKFDLITSGASNDIERATQMARAMVSMYGMSDKFDMMALESVQNRYLDGRAVRNCSEQTSTFLDEEVLKIIKEAHAEARRILRDNRELLDKISAVLIEKENIFGDEFMDLIYEVYPEKKEEAEREKIEKEKRLKEVEERRARRHALDKPIGEEHEKPLTSQDSNTDKPEINKDSEDNSDSKENIETITSSSVYDEVIESNDVLEDKAEDNSSK